jgi:hypothetical protein
MDNKNDLKRMVPRIPKEEQQENLQKEIELQFCKLLHGIAVFIETLNRIADKS